MSTATLMSTPTEDQVRNFLLSHPDFLRRHPDLLAEITAPLRELGGTVEDFQHHLLRRLQNNTKALKTKYDGLVDFCRDTMSVQSQVHEACLHVMRARNLELLLEVLTIDFPHLFDIDVVRLAIEADLPEQYKSLLGDPQESGIVFVEPGLIDSAIGEQKEFLLVADAQSATFPGFEEILAESASLVQSAALMRLPMEEMVRSVSLVFGSRHRERFHPGQGSELLMFLAQVVGFRMDSFLAEAIGDV